MKPVSFGQASLGDTDVSEHASMLWNGRQGVSTGSSEQKPLPCPGESLLVLNLEQHILRKFSDFVQATEIKLNYFCPYHRNGIHPLTYLKDVFIYSMYR